MNRIGLRKCLQAVIDLQIDWLQPAGCDMAEQRRTVEPDPVIAAHFDGLPVGTDGDAGDRNDKMTSRRQLCRHRLEPGTNLHQMLHRMV